MKKIVTYVAFISSLLGGKVATANTTLWQNVDKQQAPSAKLMVIKATDYKVFTLNESWLKWQMFGLTTNENEAMTIELPMGDGSMMAFKVWDAPMMPEKLASKYTEIRTFTGVSVSNPRITAKLDFTVFGFHAMIFAGENTTLIDPYDRLGDGFYLVRYKHNDYRDAADKMHCDAKHEGLTTADEILSADAGSSTFAARTGNGWQLRTYSLALCANHFYCQAATGSTTPTIAACLSVMTTSMNRINGVYEREFSIHMDFVANEDTLIWPTNTGSINGTDPFGSAATNSNGAACLPICQTTCTNRIGSANYDLGHVFTTGGGGISGLGIVCNNSQKARSCTGSPSPVGDSYDIDYVAHEMGHQFGSQHTFNNNTDGSCGGNAVSNYAYEPGSGTSIMAYAGICSPDNLASHSQDYFHASSLVQIYGSLTTTEDVCATKTSTGNKLPYVPAFTASYSIPYKTPFELIAPTATDSVGGASLTYCWEQWNRGSASTSSSSRLVNTFRTGPLFRTFSPVDTTKRIFPKNSMVLAGSISDAGVDGNQGEKLPDTTRYLTFKLTARALLSSGKGSFNFPDDTIHIDAISSGAANSYKGFTVTSQSTTGVSYDGGTTQTITWDKVNTDVAPINCSQVVIYLSTNGGLSWTTNLGTFPNTGTATVTLPNPATTVTNARIKVKGVGNIFFNVNKKNFTITHNSTASVSSISEAVLVDVYPVPTSEVLYLDAHSYKGLQATIYNIVGQMVWNGELEGKTSVNVSTWAKGVYHVMLYNNETGEKQAKSVIIQ